MSEDDTIKRMRYAQDLFVIGKAPASGVRPRRIKGYYRALKRGAPWAVRLSKQDGLTFLFHMVYGSVLKELIPMSKLNIMFHNSNTVAPGFYHQPVVILRKDEK